MGHGGRKRRDSFGDEVSSRSVLKKRKEACPQETRTPVRVLHPKAERGRWTQNHRHHLKGKVCRLTKTPVSDDESEEAEDYQ